MAMKKTFTLLVALLVCVGVMAQIDTTTSVVIKKADKMEFEHRLSYAGQYQEISGVTQILGIVFSGIGTGLMVAHLKTGKEGFALGSYGCFGVGGALLITSGGFKIAHGAEIRNLRLKYGANQYSYPESRK